MVYSAISLKNCLSAAKITLTLAAMLLFVAALAGADVVLDGTMTKNILPFTDGRDGRIAQQNGIYDVKPEYGKQVGGNLYHSFSKFDVEAGKTALFSGPSDISNIIGRVTGGSLSMIDGCLKSTINGADLFFLNPAGIMFGPNASLDISGSVHISTADYVRLNDGSRFMAAATSSELLTSAPPAAFGFLDASVSSIEISGANELSAPASQSISIVGGDILINGGKVSASGGRIDLVGVASSGEVECTDEGLGFSSIDSFGGVNLIEKSSISVDGAPAGDIYIQAGKFYMNNGEMSSVSNGGSGNGLIEIQAEDVHLSEGSTISGRASGGEGSAVSIKATGSVVIEKNSKISTLSWHPQGLAQSKKAGDVTITANNFICSDIGKIETVSVEGGKGGDIRITAENDVRLSSRNSTLNSSVFNGTGDAGDISIAAKNVFFENGGGVASHANDAGNGGQVRIEADETVAFRSVDKEYASTISTLTFGDMENAGAAGDIVITARDILFENGGGVNANTKGPGNAGNIKINASNGVKLNGVNANPDDGQPSAIKSQSETSAKGKAGDIFIKSGTLSVQNGALISNRSDGSGDAGSIILTAEDSIELRKGGKITTEAASSGGGDISITTQNLLRMKKGDITTSVMSGHGDGGNINIHSTHLVLDQSRIVANAYEGKGGNIQITADQLIRTSDSEISASSRLGIDGSVEIRSPETDIGGLLQAMADDYLNAENWLRTPCAERSGENAGRFVMSPRDAVPTPFDDWLGIPPQAFDDLSPPQLLLADAHQRKGFHYKALDALQHALDSPENSDAFAKAVTLNALSDLHLCLGNLKKARTSLDKGMTFARDSGNPLAQAALWNNKGNLAAIDGDKIGAEQAYTQSLEWIERLDQKTGGALLLKSTSLINLARLHFQAEDDVSYAAILQTALEETRNLPDAYPKAAHLTAIALLAEKTLETKKQGSAALANISKQAILLAGKLGKQLNIGRIQAEILGLMAGRFTREDRLDDADACLRNAILTAQNEQCPEILYDLYRRRANVLAATGDVENALTHCELALSTLTPIRSEFFKGYRQNNSVFSQKVAPVYSTCVELLFRMAKKDHAPAQKEKRLKKARAILDLQRIAELENYYQDECLSPRQAPNSPPYFADDNAVLIYPVPMREKLALLLIFSDAIQTIDVDIGASTLRKYVKRMRRLLQEELTRPERDLRSLYYAKKLHRFIIAPLEKILDNRHIDTLVFCPDSLLRQLPFAALHDGNQYLIEKYAMAVIPSLSSIRSGSEEDIAASAPLIAGLSKPRHGFPQIQNVTEEITKVRREMGGHILADERFTRKNLMTALQTTPYRIIHLATHGHFGRTSDNAYLLAYDGKIALDELENFIGVGRYREAPIELLTLSACQTALGDDRAALGLAGVSLRAGAKSAMATLWRVEDRAASELIGAFYARLKDDKAPLAKALQQAQNDLLGSERFSHPAFWSPFVIIGNWL